MQQSIYLDNSATTRLREEVRLAMQPFLADCWGNASSIHRMGREARQAIDTARAQVARLIGAGIEEIFLTPSATYSNNAAILGRAKYVERNAMGRHLITSAIEHQSALGPARHLQENGWRVTVLPVDRYGLIDPAQLQAAIAPDTSIVSLMWANNEIGAVQPIDELAAIAKDNGCFFHTDAVQVAGKLPIDVSRLPADTLSLSGHKFHAPKGIGVLYIRKGVILPAITFGGGQERGIAPGTESVADMVAIGVAAELAQQELVQSDGKLRRIQKSIFDKLLSLSTFSVTGPTDLGKRIPGHVSGTIAGVIGEDLVRAADLKGVCISSVSACHSGGTDPSHVLKAVGCNLHESLGSLRITAGWFNSEEESLTASQILLDVITEATTVTAALSASHGASVSGTAAGSGFAH